MRAVITGATSGIGKSFAFHLAAEGCDLVLTGRRQDVLSKVAAEIAETYAVRAEIITGDLGNPQVERELINSVTSQPVDYLVNNAGSGLSADFADADPEVIERLRDLLSGLPGRLIRAALPGMRESGTGTIINVGSLAGRLAVPGSSIYVASKIYLERLTETLALELAGLGIVVQALIPGYVKTDFHRAVPDYKARQRSRGAIRWLEPDEVVRLSLAAVRRARLRQARYGLGTPRPRDVVVIPGRMNRLLSTVSRFIPKRIIYRAAANRSRMEEER